MAQGQSKSARSTSAVDAPSGATLTEQIVMFLDVLGSRLLATDHDAEKNLQNLSRALTLAHEIAALTRSSTTYRLATFTDNLVLGRPVGRSNVSSLAHTVRQAAAFQYALTRFGLFVRGGLTRGPLYMHTDFVFGPGLVEAYRLESSVAVQPRIVVSETALEPIRRRVRLATASSNIRQLLLVSGDGHVFVNYLEVVKSESTGARAELQRHKRRVQEALRRSRGSARIWEKYRWLADYHNFFCTVNYPRREELLISPHMTTTRFERLP